MFVTSTVGFSSDALAEDRAARHRAEVARRELQIAAPREDVDRIRIDEPAVVVANVDHDAVAAAVLRVEIEVELRERARAHVLHVHVAEPPVADLRDVGAPALDPIAVEQTALGRRD